MKTFRVILLIMMALAFIQASAKRHKHHAQSVVWESSGLDGVHVNNIFHANNGDDYVVNNTRFIYYHANNTAVDSWKEIDAGSIAMQIPTQDVIRIQAIYVYSNLMLAGVGSYGLFASFDQGKTWKSTKEDFLFFNDNESNIAGFVNSQSHKLVVFLQSSAVLKRAMIDINNLNEVVNISWQYISPVSYSGYSHLQFLNNKIYVNSLYPFHNGMIFVTEDYGNTWQHITINAPEISEVTNATVYQLYITKENTFYAATNYGVYKSLHGLNWHLIGFKNKVVECLSMLKGILHIAVYGDGMYSSSDDGVHWSYDNNMAINKNKPQSGNIEYYSLGVYGSNMILGTSVGLYHYSG